jgi:hypothetical protein
LNAYRIIFGCNGLVGQQIEKRTFANIWETQNAYYFTITDLMLKLSISTHPSSNLNAHDQTWGQVQLVVQPFFRLFLQQELPLNVCF